MIEILKDVQRIDGHEVVDICAVKADFQNEDEWAKFFEEQIRPFKNIYVRHDVNSISFSLMTKPVSEGGKGCQFTALIHTALIMLENLNKFYPCRENSLTITKLQEALHWQEQRTKDRILRGVEGYNEK